MLKTSLKICSCSNTCDEIFCQCNTHLSNFKDHNVHDCTFNITVFKLENSEIKISSSGMLSFYWSTVFVLGVSTLRVKKPIVHRKGLSHFHDVWLIRSFIYFALPSVYLHPSITNAPVSAYAQSLFVTDKIRPAASCHENLSDFDPRLSQVTSSPSLRYWTRDQGSVAPGT